MPARDFPALLLALITCTRAQSPTYLCELRMSWQELDPPVVTPGYLVQIDADKLTVFAFKCQIYYPRARDHLMPPLSTLSAAFSFSNISMRNICRTGGKNF